MNCIVLVLCVVRPDPVRPPSDSTDRVIQTFIVIYITTGSMFTWLIGFLSIYFYIRFYQVYMSGSVCSLEHRVWTI